MAQRTVRVTPDAVMRLRDGSDLAIVSRQRQMEAVCDFVTVCDVAGGTISVLYGRAQTGVEGEMATTGMLIHWRDRTDARPQQEETVAFEHGVVLIDGEAISNAAPDAHDPFLESVDSDAEELVAAAVD